MNKTSHTPSTQASWPFFGIHIINKYIEHNEAQFAKEKFACRLGIIILQLYLGK